ncbi:MAG TPA: hypothetical protein VMB81_21685 [Candidatus Sulfotelmatobacter sp.]|nr:hypothetical protein [Candidatus Sulfotelmatobacter sp.]
MTDPTDILVTDSITRLDAPRGKVIVAASHGAIYAAYLAARSGGRAVILNDASVGRDAAGISGLAYLAGFGMPAATVAHDSAHIGDGADMLARGRISHVNAPAEALGVAPGQSCRVAAARLRAARAQTLDVPSLDETRSLLDRGPPAVWGIDSASLAKPEDDGTILVTGSHGALLGGKPETALKASPRAALFSDAGGGPDGAGTSRLPVLAARGVAAATVSAASARIGDAKSLYHDGVISHVNTVAAQAGARPGMTTRQFVALFLDKETHR